MADDWTVEVIFRPMLRDLPESDRARVADMLSHMAVGILKGEHINATRVVLYGGSPEA